MKKTVLVFGSISGGISLLMFIYFALTQRDTDFSSAEILGYVTIVLSLSLVFFGIKSYRDNRLNGVITFGQAFKAGILITLLSCLIYVMAWIVIYHTMIPDFMDRYAEYTINKAKESGASAAEIDKKIGQMNQAKEMYANPLFMAAFTFLEPFPIGLAVTLISSLILKRKQVKDELTAGQKLG